MTFGSLFAGIGGFDLGLERAGHVGRWQVEIDPFRRAVLAQHWPQVARFADVRTVGAHDLAPVDLICGGFPCQDLSSAGRKLGITGARSGLWAEFRRVVCELRPRYVLVENVSMLLARSGGLGTVLGDLAALGFDAEWQSLSAAAVGAPHVRERIFVLGYADGDREPNGPGDARPLARLSIVGADAGRAWQSQRRTLGRAWRGGQPVPWDADGRCTDPTLAVRVDDGLSDRMDRLGALGDAVLPQLVEWIGRRIQ